jgi:hypothetical protein
MKYSERAIHSANAHHLRTCKIQEDKKANDLKKKLKQKILKQIIHENKRVHQK